MVAKGSEKVLRVALVEFLNAVPLYYALKKGLVENNFEFVSGVPSRCAQLLYEKRVDISNASIVEYVNSDDYRILRDGCISTKERVKSVVFFLYKPLNKIKKVKLDRNSRTSNVLAKVLFKYKYKLSVDFVFEGDADCELVIGDRALRRLKNKSDTIDLAREWHELTNLPFVFAAWITNKNLPEEIIEKFIEAKRLGKGLLKDICGDYIHVTDKKECIDYLSKNISYDLDESKKTSIEVFFDYAKRCGAISRIRKLVFI